MRAMSEPMASMDRPPWGSYHSMGPVQAADHEQPQHGQVDIAGKVSLVLRLAQQFAPYVAVRGSLLVVPLTATPAGPGGS